MTANRSQPPTSIIHYLSFIIIIRTTCKLLTVTASISAQTSNLGAIYTISYGVQSEKSAHQQHHSLLAATCSSGLPVVLETGRKHGIHTQVQQGTLSRSDLLCSWSSPGSSRAWHKDSRRAIAPVMKPYHRLHSPPLTIEVGKGVWYRIIGNNRFGTAVLLRVNMFPRSYERRTQQYDL